MEIVVRVEGSEGAVRALRSLADEIGHPDKGLDEIAHEGADLAARYAPRLTGETARSIRPSSGPTSATVSAPFPAGPINYKTNRFMDRANDDLTVRSIDLMETALDRAIERTMR